MLYSQYTTYRVNQFWSHLHQRKFFTVDYSVLKLLNYKKLVWCSECKPISFQSLWPNVAVCEDVDGKDRYGAGKVGVRK